MFKNVTFLDSRFRDAYAVLSEFKLTNLKTKTNLVSTVLKKYQYNLNYLNY